MGMPLPSSRLKGHSRLAISAALSRVEGRQVMTLASQRWCDASIAAGADEAAARAAADRTTAAYTGTGS